MRKSLKNLAPIIAITVVAAMAGCATEPPGAVPAQSTRLKAAEIQALAQRSITENLVFDDQFDGGLRYVMKTGGMIDVRSRTFSKIVPAAWRVDSPNNVLCIRIEQDQENCYAMFWLGGTSYYIDVPNLSQRANTFTLRRP